MTFDSLGIVEPILKALENKGYSTPTPIQAQAIPILLEHKDLLGCAQTGTGKTAAFTIPIIQNLIASTEGSNRRRPVKALIVTPTRELAIQIADNITAYAKYTSLKSTVIFGGVTQGKQKAAIKSGIDILIATPGRLLDYIGQGVLSLGEIEYFVLDEADQMLDMGFIHDIKRIIKLLPKKRQSLFFSATMPKSIVELSGQILGSHPERVTIKPKQATAEKVSQALYYVSKREKIDLLIHLIKKPGKENNSTLVFSRTKHGADRIVRKLKGANIEAAAIHGNKSQVARQRALGDFKKGKINVLIATDIAARGIDVSELELVVNYDLPNVPETYVHRIGRTGRAEASGLAISFCDGVERAYLKDIERLINQRIPLIEDQPFPDDGTIPEPPPQTNRPNNRRNSSRGGAPNRNNNRSNSKRGNAEPRRRNDNSPSNRRNDEKAGENREGRREDTRSGRPDRKRNAPNPRNKKPDNKNADRRNAPREESKKQQRPDSKKSNQDRKPRRGNDSKPKNIPTREDKLKWPLL